MNKAFKVIDSFNLPKDPISRYFKRQQALNKANADLANAKSARELSKVKHNIEENFTLDSFSSALLNSKIKCTLV